MKRFLAAVLVCLFLSGCEALSFSVDPLLVAPSIADEQAAIHAALIEGLGRGITISYPRSGENRSAFLIQDIDGDGNDEALAFYLTQGAGENVKVAVLDKDDDGSWHRTCEIPGNGSGIDSVRIASYGRAVDIIIGYENQGFEDKKLGIYRYNNGSLYSLYDGGYTMMDMLDLDGCGTKEIVIIKKLGTIVSVGVIKTSNGLSYVTGERILDVAASSVVGYTFGGLYDNVNALFVDITDENGSCATEAIYMQDGEIVTLTSAGQDILRLTNRPPQYRTMDYDGDGIVEIPIVTPFLGYASGQSDAEFMTSWLSYNSDLKIFEVESSTYYSVPDGYIFRLPGRWLNLVSVVKDDDLAVFVKYDYGETEQSELPRLVSLASANESNISDYLDNGYNYIKGNDFVSYMAKRVAPESEPLLLTWDEISSNLFYVTE